MGDSIEHPGALVLGVRPVHREAAALNRFGNDFANTWVRIATGRAFDDTQCGLRVYPIAETLALSPTGRRFDFETEILIRASAPASRSARFRCESTIHPSSYVTATTTSSGTP